MRKLLIFLFLLAVPTLFAAGAKADVLSNDYVDLKLGGWIKLDMFFNTNSVTNIDAPLWVNTVKDSKGKVINDKIYYGDAKSYSATVRGSRLWLTITGKNLPENVKLGSYVEVDFYGDYATTATGPRLPQMALRHYYATLGYKWFTLTAGQTWIIIAPLNPGSFDTLALAGKGNLWQRIPQISAKGDFSLAEGHTLKLAVGVMRPLSARDINAQLVDNGSVGEITGLPMFQGRLAYAGSKLGPVNFELGVSGSYHQEKYVDPANKYILSVNAKSDAGKNLTIPWSSDDPVNAYVAAVDFKFEIAPVTLTTEWYYGQNMDTFWGNMIKYGAIPTLHMGDATNLNSAAEYKSIKEFGGFVNVGAVLIEKLYLNAGFGIAKTMDIEDYYADTKAEYPVKGKGASDAGKYTLTTDGVTATTLPPERQTSLFVNVGYMFFKGFFAGIECQHITTTYFSKAIDANAGTITKTRVTVADVWTNLMLKYTF